MHHRDRVPLLVAAGLVAVGVLAGCSSGGGRAASPSTVASSAVPSASSTADGATSAPSGAATGGATTGGASAPASAPTGGGSGVAATAPCSAGSLRAGEEAGSGGAAGSTYTHLTLENTGTTSCTLQGWPGVSFVGGGTGTQIGAAASQDRASAHPTVTLAPGQEAVAPLKITNAQDYPSAKCHPVTPDGFRVYPPGSKQSLYVEDRGHPACRSTAVTILNVQALVPQGQAVD
ncbi:DUF4232 domain-containing protein [Curtobacterium sp. 22159]|uniref:DUF4232 domain-containing protein n=1 Tax=Curtobacterium sp. 22159 TaxID=3453882 RepID=UPI003F83906C